MDCSEQAKDIRSTQETPMKATAKAKTLADWRATNVEEVVIANKIRARFAAMLKAGPEEHDTNADFAKAIDVAPAKLASYREEFKQHIVYSKLGGRDGTVYWFADVKVAEKARGGKAP